MSKLQFSNKFFNEAPDPIIIADNAGNICFSNQEFSKVFGYLEEEIIGKPVEILLNPESTGKHVKLRKEYEKKRAPIRMGSRKVLYATKKDGGTLPVDIMLTPYDHDGEQCTIALIRDLTETQKSEKLKEQFREELEKMVEQRTQELLESKKKFELITNNVSDLICVHDINFQMTYASPSSTYILGYEPKELIGMSSFCLTLEEDVAGLRKQIEEHIKSKSPEPKQLTYRLKKKNGVHIWVESKLTLIFNKSSSDVIGFQRVTREITERIESMEALKKALEKEKELSRNRTRFVSLASHQFRTPLSVLKTNVEIIQHLVMDDLMQKSPDYVKRFDRIHSVIDRMLHLMDELLLMSKLRTKDTNFLNLKEESIVDVARHLISLYREINGDRNIKLEVHGNVVKQPIDREKITHSLSNLISNAIKYSEEGSDPPEVHIFYKEETVVIMVKDYGIGIPKSEHSHIFSEFYRASNTEEKEGVGLGLIIIKEMIEAHQGKVWFESVENKGSQFYFAVPYKIDYTPDTPEPLPGVTH